MNKTADGYEFDLGRTEWRNESDRQQWETPVTIKDGDKRMTLTVVSDAKLKGALVPQAVQASMREWSYRGYAPKAAKAM